MATLPVTAPSTSDRKIIRMPEFEFNNENLHKRVHIAGRMAHISDMLDLIEIKLDLIDGSTTDLLRRAVAVCPVAEG
jgi:hypothetical protein